MKVEWINTCGNIRRVFNFEENGENGKINVVETRKNKIDNEWKHHRDWTEREILLESMSVNDLMRGNRQSTRRLSHLLLAEKEDLIRYIKYQSSDACDLTNVLYIHALPTDKSYYLNRELLAEKEDLMRCIKTPEK